MPWMPGKMTPERGLREKSPSPIVADQAQRPAQDRIAAVEEIAGQIDATAPPLQAGCQLRPASRVRKTPPGNMADGQPTAQPCRWVKKRIFRRAGSSTGSRCQVNPPSRVLSTTPELSCR